MLSSFRRKAKTTATGFATEVPNKVAPPSYKSTNDSWSSAEKEQALDPHLDTGCSCHGRYHALASSLESNHASYLSLPTKVQKKTYTIWALGRTKALQGIIRTPISPCAEKCECHAEYAILKRKLESYEQAIDSVRSGAKMRSEDAMRSYGRWIGEVGFLWFVEGVCW